MLNWRVCRVREGCGYDKVRRRKRRGCLRRYVPYILLGCAGLILICLCPAWAIAVLVAVLLLGIGIIWLLS